MTDRPIIFSAPMVCALLAGRKTQTRRVLKPQPEVVDGDGRWYRMPNGGLSLNCHPGPRYVIGDRLWVREAHALLPRTAYRGSVGTGTIDQREHPTDGYTAAVFREGFDRSGRPLWRPSIHMPRWASRLTLTVTDVRVQRLQDISPADAEAEGIEDVSREVASRDKSERYWRRYRDGGCNGYVDCPIGSFASLWTEINGPGAWETNPWIVALTFTVERRNIDV